MTSFQPVQFGALIYDRDKASADLKKGADNLNQLVHNYLLEPVNTYEGAFDMYSPGPGVVDTLDALGFDVHVQTDRMTDASGDETGIVGLSLRDQLTGDLCQARQGASLPAMPSPSAPPKGFVKAAGFDKTAMTRAVRTLLQTANSTVEERLYVLGTQAERNLNTAVFKRPDWDYATEYPSPEAAQEARAPKPRPFDSAS